MGSGWLGLEQAGQEGCQERAWGLILELLLKEGCSQQRVQRHLR